MVTLSFNPRLIDSIVTEAVRSIMGASPDFNDFDDACIAGGCKLKFVLTKMIDSEEFQEKLRAQIGSKYNQELFVDGYSHPEHFTVFHHRYHEW